MRKLVLSIAIAISMIAAPVLAQTLEEGVKAVESGDYSLALKSFRPLADSGNAVAQNNLGLMYAMGKGVPQDFAKALSWFRKAADQGFAPAQNNLGVTYARGRGVPQDYAKAANWYRKAAEQGYATAQNNLGLMYYNGRGVPQNYILAHMWLNISGANGNKNGRYNRDLVETKMTPSDISQAQARASACIKSNYQNCD